MAGYTLILAILVLGGIIATLGDRIGTKVGKARLSIFNLRPRKTATLVTIMTGGLISASTLGILLATSSQLRDGLFRLESIRKELETTQVAKQQVQAELETSRSQRQTAVQQLDQINRSLSQALLRQSETQAKLQSAKKDYQKAKDELDKVRAQEQDLNSQIASLTTEQQNLTAEGQKLRQERDQIASDRENLRQKVSESQAQLKDIETQRQKLTQEISVLQKDLDRLTSSVQALRQGKVKITSGQVLAAAVFPSGLSIQDTRNAVYQILQQADQFARNVLEYPKGTEPVIQVSEGQIDKLVETLRKGDSSFVLQIQSAGNYLYKESKISILAYTTPNKQVFGKGETIASLQFPANLASVELEEQLNKLFSVVRFRARQEGVLPNPFTGEIGSISKDTLQELLQEMKNHKTSFELRAVTKEAIFSSSPLNLILIVLENGKEIRRFG